MSEKGQQEDVLHALYSCPKLEELWSLNPLWNHSSLKQTTSFLDLIGNIFTENRDPTFFPIVWALWKRSNDLRIGKACGTLGQLFSQAKDRLREFAMHNTTMTSAMQRTLAQWTPPDNEHYKINFDGALFQADNCAGIGVVIRNGCGQVMASLSQQIPLPLTVIEVEALVARRALILVQEISFTRVVLEGDSQTLITALKTGSHTLAHFGHIAQDIRYLASSFSDVSYTHVRRQCNTVAHSLARRAILSPFLQVWMEDVPLELVDVLQADFQSLD
ncbi:uncharacterized protein LOC142640202 [Castanea sativa]|uniref:uncharacterized protein LOC142640202 n=1 Tax=Castanea sativa TaxID=21020 RepID=UPI003F64A842